ncbi:MAG: Panacea domain-containing protein [Candidatus Thiodiazotropha taylori]|nr:SocA family protein [Candidatus Thiodiazotropha taylori]MCG8113284.1 SocA family protein [Candidatus Thiodiazotropha taylori]MCW4285645.1 Panacea domain-containing protein [Candidatus Thiodiazotropha taylori]MCW4327734.1 Panacea domain-containing protein [Candidatus Thiodiazotropha taylori]
MLKNRQSEKLLNIVAFFVQNTRYCGKTKLFKLIYFLDFEHYSDTGRSVSGLDYYAWPMGPVPVELNDQIESSDPKLTDALEVSQKPLPGGKAMVVFTPKIDFDAKLFTRRELRLMESLAQEFNVAKADDMVEATHLENLPWHQVYEVEGRKQQLIPYDLAFRKAELDASSRTAREHREFTDNYK